MTSYVWRRLGSKGPSLRRKVLKLVVRDKLRDRWSQRLYFRQSPVSVPMFLTIGCKTGIYPNAGPQLDVEEGKRWRYFKYYCCFVYFAVHIFIRWIKSLGFSILPPHFINFIVSYFIEKMRHSGDSCVTIKSKWDVMVNGKLFGGMSETI